MAWKNVRAASACSTFTGRGGTNGEELGPVDTGLDSEACAGTAIPESWAKSAREEAETLGKLLSLKTAVFASALEVEEDAPSQWQWQSHSWGLLKLLEKKVDTDTPRATPSKPTITRRLLIVHRFQGSQTLIFYDFAWKIGNQRYMYFLHASIGHGLWVIDCQEAAEIYRGRLDHTKNSS